MMTLLISANTICCILPLACLLNAVTGETNCVFPEFLRAKKHERWLYKVRLNEERTGIKAYSLSVTQSVISFAPYYPSDSKNFFFQWTCLTKLGEDSYFVEVAGRRRTRYKCIDIVHLSDNAKRFKMSEEVNHDDGVRCDDLDRTLHPWLLVKGGSAPFQTVPCSLIGGFNIQITDTSGRMCNKLHLVPRLEVGCFEDDKMYFDFQNCPHERFTPLMERKQALHCIAEWTEGPQKYVVMRQPKKDHYWLLKLPTRSPDMNYFAATLSSVLTTNTGDSHSVALQLMRKVVTDICVDAADDCKDVNINRNELCSGMYGAIYCKQTCGFCDRDQERDCSIDRSAIGPWEFVVENIDAKHGRQRFSVSEHNFKTKSLLNTTCLVHSTDYDYHEYVFVKYQANGCYPRFTCVSSHVTNRVMFFKESRGATWPQYEEDYFCSARTYDFLPPEPTWRVAVKERSSLSPVLCNIPMDLYDFETRLEGIFCQGRLQTSSCSALKSTGFSIMFNESDSCDLADVHFDCISSKIYEEPGDKRVAMLLRDKEQVYYCFIFDLQYTSATRIPANECHEEFIFWDHTEMQHFELAPSDGICIERKTVAHSGANILPKCCLFIIPVLLTAFHFLLSS